MRLLLFHGTEILGFFAGAVLGAGGLITALVLLLTRPPANPTMPAMTYFLLAIIVCTGSLSVPNAGPLQLLVVVVCFPWSVVIVFLFGFLDGDPNFGLWFLGAVLNAGIIYLVAKFARQRLRPAANNLE